jgi:hypothetical protein
MNSTLFVLWAILAALVLGLAFYRKLVADREDDSLHVGPGEEKIILEQKHIAARLATLDRWGKTLTVITVAYGLVILLITAISLYQAWLRLSST